MKIRQKLLLTVVGMTLLVGFMGYFSILENVRIIRRIVQLTQSSISQVNSSTEMFNAAQRIQIDTLELAYREPPRSRKDVALMGGLRGEIRQNLAKFKRNLDVSVRANQQAISLARRSELHDIERSPTLNRVLLGRLETEFDEHSRLISEFLDLSETDIARARVFLQAQVQPHFEHELFPLIGDYNISSEKKQVQQITQIEADLEATNDMLFVSTVVCLGIAIALGLLIARTITEPIIRLKNAVLQVGRGRMSTRIDVGSRDEVGVLADAFNQMVADLSRTTVSKAYVDNIIQSMADPLIVLNAEAQIIMVNQATLSLLCFEEHELMGRHIAVILAEGDVVESSIDQLIEEGIIANIEKRLVARDGRQIPVYFSFSVMQDENGRTSGIVCVAKDITERKQAEEALRHAHDELEIRVRQRTAELARTNEALEAEIAVRKQAEERIRNSLGEKEVLLKEIHHRVKNNLQVISSLLYLNARKIGDKKTSDLFSDSQHRIRSMALIHEKLYQSADLAHINFRDYVRNLANYLVRSYGSDGAPVELTIDAEDIALEIDTAIPLGLIINELVSNSLKHAFPDGWKGVINISLHSSDGAGYLLEVGDNGVGLPADAADRRQDSLGMQLVDNLVNQIGGSMEMQNGNGLQFQIRFSQHARR